MEKKEAFEKYMTMEEWINLPYLARVQADYWARCCPKLMASLKKEGTLMKTLTENGERLSDREIEMVDQGVHLDVARELIMQEVLSPAPEE